MTATRLDETEHGPGLLEFGRAAAISTALLGLVISTMAYFVFGSKAALGVMFGAVLGGLNFWGLAWILRGFFAARAGKGPLFVMAPLKLAVLFGGIYLLVRFDVVELLPLLIGYALLPLGASFAQLLPAASQKG